MKIFGILAISAGTLAVVTVAVLSGYVFVQADSQWVDVSENDTIMTVHLSGSFNFHDLDLHIDADYINGYGDYHGGNFYEIFRIKKSERASFNVKLTAPQGYYVERIVTNESNIFIDIEDNYSYMGDDDCMHHVWLPESRSVDFVVSPLSSFIYTNYYWHEPVYYYDIYVVLEPVPTGHPCGDSNCPICGIPGEHQTGNECQCPCIGCA